MTRTHPRRALARRTLAALGAVALAAAGALAAAPATASAATGPATPANTRAVCAQPAAGHASCLAEVRTDIHGGRGVRGPAAHAALGSAAATLPTGYSPAQLHAAYNLPNAGGASQTVAIVDAGDDASAEADLAVYRQTYGLSACTTADGCFSKVNQQGQAAPLPADNGWAVEISLDLDMVSAACADCHILLVEADSASFSDLAAAEDTAAALGATEISNSYGGDEGNDALQYEPAYSHPGIAVVASSGDYGYGIPEFPAVAQSVIAVGGTTLTQTPSTARGWTEMVWNSGPGAAAWVDKPSWQTDPDCPGRTVADVAADADPETGPAVYDTADGQGGWLVVGGTSASSPFIAGVIALAGNPQLYPNASRIYASTADLNDVTSGNNIYTENCGGDYLCDGAPGYDAPTGNGTPNGLAAF
jgi:subtilase family serine protease